MAEIRYIGLAAMVAKAQAVIRTAAVESAEAFAALAMEAESAVVSGTLKGGIHIDQINQAGSSVNVRVATGGESGAYSVYIHEGHRADGTHAVAAYPDGLRYFEEPLLSYGPTHTAHLERAARAAF